MYKEDIHSIFAEYYQPTEIVDRFATDRARAVDVIIPIIHTNEIWRANLLSIYREIPVNRLILGDGGCIDGSIDIARKFPRVEVLDHRSFKSLGFSLRHLIEETTTDWFVYLHSDVFLPPGWFDAMSERQSEFDWFECNQRITVMADYLLDTTKILRSYSGSQMGRKAAFKKVTPLIDDDYLYRNEDIIIAKLVERAGFKYGKVGQTHHFHQVMYKPSRWHRSIKRISIEPDIARDEDIRANRTYSRGIIKYLDPSETTSDVVQSVLSAVERLIELEDTSAPEFLEWVKATNPNWIPELAPSPAIAVSAAQHLPRRTLHERAAERFYFVAETYRLHGGPFTAMLVLRLSQRRIARILFPRSLNNLARNSAKGIGFYPRRIAEEYRASGVSGVFRLFSRQLPGGRKHDASPDDRVDGLPSGQASSSGNARTAGRWINAMLGPFGLRLLKSASVLQLQKTTRDLSGIVTAQGAQLRELDAQFRKASDDAASQTAKVAELNKSLDRMRKVELERRRQVDRLETLLRRILSRPGGFSEAQVLSVTEKKPNIVLVITAVSQLPQLRAFAEAAAIRQAYDLTVVAYFHIPASDLKEYCVENGISLLNHRCEVLNGSDSIAAWLDIDEVQPYFGAGVSLDDYQAEDRLVVEPASQLLAEVHWQNTTAVLAQRLLRGLPASAVVLFEDNAEYHTGIWVAVSRQNGIPVVVLPYAIIDSGDAAEAHYNDPAHMADSRAINKFVAAALPRWVFAYRDRLLLRRSAIALLTSEALGFSQPKPWVWNSTRADVLAVESEAMRDVYLAQGLPEDQIEVTGSISDDLLRAALKNADGIRQDLGLDARLRTLVCAFPPNQLDIGRPDPEFDDFRMIVDRWLGELSRLEGWQVVVKPHPSMRKEDVEYLRTFPFPVTDLDTTSLVAVCDLFNTSVSSTIRWAIACGKPVINYDVYRYRYQDFVKEPAVLTMYDFEDFARELHRLTGDRAELEKLSATARASSARWGMLDGGSTERIVKLLDRLTGRQRPSLITKG